MTFIKKKLESNPNVFDKLINDKINIVNQTDIINQTDVVNQTEIDEKLNSVWSFVESTVPHCSMVFLKLFVKNNDMLEKINDYNNLASIYCKLIKNRKGNKKSLIIFDINKIKSFDDFKIEMNKCENIIIYHNNKQKILGKLKFTKLELEICINNKNIMVYCPLTFEAAQYLGHKTNWCTSKHDFQFEKYTKTSKLYIVKIIKNNELFQFSFGKECDLTRKNYIFRKSNNENMELNKLIEKVNDTEFTDFIANKMCEYKCMGNNNVMMSIVGNNFDVLKSLVVKSACANWSIMLLNIYTYNHQIDFTDADKLNELTNIFSDIIIKHEAFNLLYNMVDIKYTTFLKTLIFSNKNKFVILYKSICNKIIKQQNCTTSDNTPINLNENDMSTISYSASIIYNICEFCNYLEHLHIIELVDFYINDIWNKCDTTTQIDINTFAERIVRIIYYHCNDYILSCNKFIQYCNTNDIYHWDKIKIAQQPT